MKVKEIQLEDGMVQLNAVANSDEVNKQFDAAEVAFASQLGIRPVPDKTPAEAIAEKLGITDVDSVVRPQVQDALVPFAIDARNIFPDGNPQVSSDQQLMRNSPFEFKVVFHRKPVYELSSYEPVEIEVSKFEFDESLIEKQMAQMTKTYPEFVSAEAHPLAMGDTCRVALEASLNGEKIENLCTESRTLSLGQGFMPEDFEKQIIGMAPGDTKSFSFEGPTWTEEGEKTDTYECTVTIIEIQEETYPELTDEWVQRSMPMYKGVDDLRAAVEKSLMGEARRQHDNEIMSVAQEKLAERFDGAISNEAYESTAANIRNALQVQLSQQGTSLDKFIEENGGEQNFNVGLMMQARTTLRCDYALDALYRHAGLEITDEDIDRACLEMNPSNPRAVRIDMEKTGRGFALREVAQRVAASRYLVDNAIITVRED